MTADKGLAGAYNHNVLKIAEEELEKCSQSHLLVVGEVGRQYFHSRKIPVDQHFLYTAQNPTMHRARVITGKVLSLYESGKVDEVHMIYTSMKNGLQTETNEIQLLPIKKSIFQTEKIPMDMLQEEILLSAIAGSGTEQCNPELHWRIHLRCACGIILPVNTMREWWQCRRQTTVRRR